MPVHIIHDKTIQASNFAICGPDFIIGQVHNTAKMRIFVWAYCVVRPWRYDGIDAEAALDPIIYHVIILVHCDLLLAGERLCGVHIRAVTDLFSCAVDMEGLFH